MQSFLLLLVSIHVVTANTPPGQAAQPKSTSTSTTSPTSTSTTSPTPNPSSCDAYGNITYNAPSWVGSVSYSCGTSLTSVTVPSKPYVLRGCPLDTPVNITMYKEANTHTGTISTAPVEKTTLTCSGTPDQSVYTVSVNFQERYSTLPPLIIKETLTLTMTINAQNGTHSVTQVVLGKKYDLRVTGAGDNYMRIKTCSARGNSDMGDAVLVYEASNPGAHNPAVIDSQETLTESGTDKHPLKATMTGFRLVGSSTVYLQCNVEVCDHDNCNVSRERKRTKSDIKTASVKFEVIGTHSVRQTNGARETNSAGKSVVTIAMFIVATYLSF